MLYEGLSKLIGQVSQPTVMEVEKGAIKRFADSVADYNPLFWNEDYACNTRWGGTIAPPGFFGWPCYWEAMPMFDSQALELRRAMVAGGYDRLLDGGIEYDFFLPVRAGDTLVASSRITNIREREGKGGKMLFCSAETAYYNQNGNLVAKARKTVIGLE